MEQTVDLLRLNFKSDNNEIKNKNRIRARNAATTKRRHFNCDSEEGFDYDEDDDDEIDDEIDDDEEQMSNEKSRSNYETSTNNNNTLEEIFENLNEDENTHNSPTNKS